MTTFVLIWIQQNTKLLAAIQNVKVVDDGRKVNVTWDNGKSFK